MAQNHVYRVRKSRSFRNAKGTLVHVYFVLGNEAALARYREIQGENLREHQEQDANGNNLDHPMNGTPLFFSTTEILQGGTIVETQGRRNGGRAGFAVEQGTMGNMLREEARNAIKQLMNNSFGSPSDDTSPDSTGSDTTGEDLKQEERNKQNMENKMEGATPTQNPA